MLLRGLNFTSSFLFSSRTVLHRAYCFTMGKESFELSHVPACCFPDLHPSPGCSCAWGNNLLRWQLQKSITPWMPWAWRTETAQKHATAHWHLYMAPHHTSSAGTEATDENICSKTFSVLSLRFGVVFFSWWFLVVFLQTYSFFHLLWIIHIWMPLHMHMQDSILFTLNHCFV